MYEATWQLNTHNTNLKNVYSCSRETLLVATQVGTQVCSPRASLGREDRVKSVPSGAWEELNYVLQNCTTHHFYIIQKQKFKPFYSNA